MRTWHGLLKAAFIQINNRFARLLMMADTLAKYLTSVFVSGGVVWAFFFDCVPSLNKVDIFSSSVEESVMKSENKRTQRDYSLAFKLAVVDQVETGEMTYKQAQNRYGIQGRSTVLVWLRKHGQLDWSLGCTPLHPQGVAMTSSSSLTPEQRIKELEQQLVEMEKKAEFFEAVVDVLKRDYGVTVVKKPRGKSSKRKK